jgi:hypothetical protein
MIDGGASVRALAQVRAAYDVARRAFAACYRPNHKPFICHLVGTAGALAVWGQRPDVIAAGMLHSAYLFWDFGDGAREASGAKRRFVKRRVGAEVDALIAKYTEYDWSGPLERYVTAVRNGTCDRDVMLIKLADLCDECVDAGPRFSPSKPLEFGLPHNADARELAADLAGTLAGSAARSHLAVVLETCCRATPPASLVTSDRSFHQITMNVTGKSRPHIRLRLRRIAAAFGRKRAA